MVRVLAAVLLAAAASGAVADEPPSPLEVERRVDDAYRAEILGHCVNGADLERALCFSGRLNSLDERLDMLIQRALAETENRWGVEATEEQRRNIGRAQAAWKIYRHEHCWFGYVEHQGINASSRQLDNIACEIRRTLRRTEEVKIDYMGEWQ